MQASSTDPLLGEPKKDPRGDHSFDLDDVLKSLYKTRLKFLIRVGIFGTAGYTCQAIANAHTGRLMVDTCSLSLYIAAAYFCKNTEKDSLARALFFLALSISMFIGPMLAGNFESEAAWLYGIIPLCAAHLYGPKKVLLSTVGTLAGLFFHYKIAPMFPLERELYMEGAMHTSVVFMSLVFFSAVAISSARMLEKQGSQLRGASVELIKSQAIVDAETHSKGVFMANMSHEIRTPMNGILGMLEELQQRSRKGQDEHALIDTAKESGNRLLDALNNILDVSKIEAKKLSLIDSNFHPSLVLSRVEEEFTPIAKRRGLTLSFDTPKSWPAVTGDHARLYQILAIMVDNAIRYSEKGSIQVIATHTRMEAQEQCAIELKVIDQGPGISSEAQQRIFSGFETMDDLSDQRSGIGLGLALARNLAVLMQGDIELASTVGQGSTFTARVCLPICASVPELISHQDQDPARFDFKILLVDDDPINRRVASLQLERLGCQVDQAPGGSAAIKMAASQSYDLIFMDLQMPDMSGYAAAEAILSESRAQAPRIIAFSSDANPQSLARAHKAGMIDYVVKPVRAQELQQFLSRYQEKAPEPLRRCA